MTILHGDCLDVMRGMDAESVDAIVSDPPYGLSFMGKEWDHGVPGVDFWREALRVAKPGAHLVAFGGTRTYHRLTCAIEDAGWEIRDCLSWLYGSGFPKSLDVSKAMDKMDAAEEQMQRRLRFTEWVRSTGVTRRVVGDVLRSNGLISESGTMEGHYFAASAEGQPAIMTREHLEACRHLLGDIPEWVERECDIRSVESRNFAEREVVGKHNAPAKSIYSQGERDLPQDVDITAPATDLARQWQGWGTALKPAWEPIILARKPLRGTVASNVAQYGTGAINVDGCRIEGAPPSVPQPKFGSHTGQVYGFKAGEGRNGEMSQASGRWPANVVLDECSSEMLGEPARYFYTAKASRREREAGLEGMPEREQGQQYGNVQDARPHTSDGYEYSRKPTANHHPTVKPIALMRWLCRLVTPPNGLVLDPFCGSGSTGCAAVLEGFRFVGIEREAEYVAIAEKRVAYWATQRDVPEPSLFD